VKKKSRLLISSPETNIPHRGSCAERRAPRAKKYLPSCVQATFPFVRPAPRVSFFVASKIPSKSLPLGPYGKKICWNFHARQTRRVWTLSTKGATMIFDFSALHNFQLA
jgi:hypothetical protein